MKRLLPKTGSPIKFRRTEDVYLKCPGNGPYTKELELWYQKIISCCLGHVENDRCKAFESLKTDPNTPFLTEEFSKFIADQTTYFVVNPDLKMLINLMHMLERLILNENVHNMRESLHLVLPACITCIVCTTICLRPEVDNHWFLRELAGDILKMIVDKYASPINKIKERVLTVLTNAAFDPDKDFATVYGALYALHVMTGDKVKDWLPQIMKIDSKVRSYVKKETHVMDKNRSSAIKIRDLISKIVKPTPILVSKTIGPTPITAITKSESLLTNEPIKSVPNQPFINIKGLISSPQRQQVLPTRRLPAGTTICLSPIGGPSNPSIGPIKRPPAPIQRPPAPIPRYPGVGVNSNTPKLLTHLPPPGSTARFITANLQNSTTGQLSSTALSQFKFTTIPASNLNLPPPGSTARFTTANLQNLTTGQLSSTALPQFKFTTIPASNLNLQQQVPAGTRVYVVPSPSPTTNNGATDEIEYIQLSP